ncbi:MAG: glycosyl hydrolase [Bacteroidota bacterium]
MRGVLFFLSIPFCALGALAQPASTQVKELLSSLEKKEHMGNQSLIKNIRFENIGPSVMSGRVVDLAVNPNNPAAFYVGYASGGLWYTNNNGTTFSPVMDSSHTQNIGRIAVDWGTGTIWVGTGENNASRSSYAGIGILKSTDRGKTWKSMGLADAHHVGAILINPNNPDELTVGVTGHLYSPNVERGVYKTNDGGKTWKKTLALGDLTGIIDMAHAPNNFNIQYAAAWQKNRKAWNFEGSGTGSGIYKSTDGGTSWTKMTLPESGFPSGKGVGRIGLAVFDVNTLYAVLDNQGRREKSKSHKKRPEDLVKDDFKGMSVSEFLALDHTILNTFLKTNGFQEKYRAQNVKQMVRSGNVRPADLAKYLENANSLLFDTPVIGPEVYLSTDGGKTWNKRNEDYIDDLFYSYGYYFGLIRVDPSDKDKIYLGGVPIVRSEDGGRTFVSINGDNVHADHHALWINPKRPGHLINGNDGGVNISYDNGQSWIKNNSPKVGQFYAINVDHAEPYNVYGGLQDNGVWKGPHNADENSAWHQTGHYPWEMLLGGDGMQVQIDPRNPNVVYTGFQFGNYYKLDLEQGRRTGIQPKHELGEAPLRFNWQTPIVLSSHNPDILYLGSNKLHRSLNQGADWEAISADLTQGGKLGNVAYGTLTTISESPLQFGLLYAGSDDGRLHISKNGGSDWEDIGKNIPLSHSENLPNLNGLWVSRVVASKHQKGRVYTSLNGYRWDDFTPYVFVSEDYGRTWNDLGHTLPASPVNVVLEDPGNPDLLFIGTDNGLYASMDRGITWQLFQSGMPNVAVHDLVIQPNAKHLLAGTHGRSIYKADISILQQLNQEILDKQLHVFTPNSILFSPDWGTLGGFWSRPTTPGLDIVFYSAEPAAIQAIISTKDGIAVSSTEMEAHKGLNVLSYDLAFSKSGKSNYLKKNKKKLSIADNGKTYLPKGTYLVKIKGNGKDVQTEFEIHNPSKN